LGTTLIVSARWRRRATILSAFAIVLALGVTNSAAADLLFGQVLASGTPIVGATVTLYGSVEDCVPDPCFVASKPSEEATTDAHGTFSMDLSNARATTTVMGIPPEPRFKRAQIPPAPGTLYLIASGGNAGRGINPAIRLVTLLGSAPPSRHVVINELTTALAFLCSGRISPLPGGMSPFALDLFLRLIDPTNARLKPFPGVPSNSPALVNTMANVVSACAASEGQASRDCQALFQATSPVSFSNKATDTLSATESIVFHPERNLGALFKLAKRSSAYQPALTAPPAGWMLSLSFKGGGLNRPATIITEKGPDRLWIVNSGSSALSVLSSDPFQLGNSLAGAEGLHIKGLRQPAGLWFQQGLRTPPPGTGPISLNTKQWWVTPDKIWVADKRGNDLAVITARSNGFASQIVTGNGLSAPSSIMGYPNNFPIFYTFDKRWVLYALVVVTNSGADRVSFFKLDGTACGPALENIGLNNPVGLDTFGGFVLIANSGANELLVVKPPEVMCRGARLVKRIAGGGMNAPQYVAGGFVTNGGDGSVTGLDEREEEPSRIVPGSPFRGGGLAGPEGIARDSDGAVWIANHAPRANSISFIAGQLGLAFLGRIQVGQPLSPDSGFSGAGLDRPYGIAIDKWGNVWVTNQGNDSVTVFVGAAHPPMQ
jgi:DNA-binding beta-propeller fold protein YncE